MTEREQLEAMMRRAGIVFRALDANGIAVMVDDNETRAGVYAGYGGFETRFTFDVYGLLLQIGSWE